MSPSLWGNAFEVSRKKRSENSMVAAGNGPSTANQRLLQYVTWKGKKWNGPAPPNWNAYYLVVRIGPFEATSTPIRKKGMSIKFKTQFQGRMSLKDPISAASRKSFRVVWWIIHSSTRFRCTCILNSEVSMVRNFSGCWNVTRVSSKCSSQKFVELFESVQLLPTTPIEDFHPSVFNVEEALEG